MRYRLTGFLLLIISVVNLYAIINRMVLGRSERQPFYYYLLVAAALVLGIYYLFLKNRKSRT